MGTFATLEEAQECFVNDRFATGNGCVLEEVGDAYAVASVEIRDEHRNGLGSVMGGLIFTLADFAFAVVANQQHYPTVGLDGDIRFLSATKGTKLFARGTLVKTGRATTVCRVEVTDDLGRDIALFIGTGMKM